MMNIKEKLKKLEYYETLDEQGLLIKLPCKIGTKVYEIERYSIGKEFVSDGYDHLGEYGHYTDVIRYKVRETKFRLSDINKIGEDIFLTKKEADMKLRELRFY